MIGMHGLLHAYTRCLPDNAKYHDLYWDKTKKEIKQLKGMSSKEMGTSGKKKSRSKHKNSRKI